MRNIVVAAGVDESDDAGFGLRHPARALAQSELKVRMADTEFGEAIRLSLDVLGTAEFAQQVQHDFCLAIELLAAARLELRSQHPRQSDAERDQEYRRGSGEQYDQAGRQRKARRRRSGHVRQTRSSST